MKRLCAIFILLSAAYGAFAFGVSAGIGVSTSAFSFDEGMSGTLGGVTDSATYTLTQTPIQAKVFIDATYFQLAAGYLIANGGNQSATQTGALSFGTGTVYSDSYLTFSGLLEIPLNVGGFSFFPLIGAEYDYNLTLTDTSGNNLKPQLTSQQLADLNQLWLKGGAGVNLTFGRFFLRPELLAGFKLHSVTDNNTIAAVENYVTSYGYSNASATITWWTWDFSLLLGYKL